VLWYDTQGTHHFFGMVTWLNSRHSAFGMVLSIACWFSTCNKWSCCSGDTEWWECYDATISPLLWWVCNILFKWCLPWVINLLPCVGGYQYCCGLLLPLVNWYASIIHVILVFFIICLLLVCCIVIHCWCITSSFIVGTLHPPGGMGSSSVHHVILVAINCIICCLHCS